MKEINIKELKESIVSLFDDRWALITAGTEESWNTMTASWGGFGIFSGCLLKKYGLFPEKSQKKYLQIAGNGLQ